MLAIGFHQLFEGISLGIRIAGLPTPDTPRASKCPSLLQPVLAVLFAIMTPAGIALGLLSFSGAEPGASPAHTPVCSSRADPHFRRAVSSASRVFWDPRVLCLVHMKFIEGLLSAVSAGMLIYAACVEMLAADFVLNATSWRHAPGKQVLAIGSLLAGVAAMSALG